MRSSTSAHALLQFGLVFTLITAVAACRPITQTPAAPASEPSAAAAPAPAGDLPPAGKTIQTGDIVTYYEEYGQGDPVILLHGSFSSAADFAALIPALAEEFKVYAVDSRGRGRTTDAARPISYMQMMSDTVAFMDAIGLDKAHIVGVSDGAVIGLDMAIHHPERLKSLVAFGAGWDGTRMAPWYPDWITSVTIDDLKDWANAYSAVSPHPERAELVLEKIRAMQLAPKKISADLLKTIPVPVLVMDGENEEFFSLDLAKELAAAVPNSELALMKGTGHFAAWEKPEEFNTIVMEYLRRH